MRSLVDDLGKRFDIVLIDSPPVLPVADALILSGYADTVLLVVAAGHTRRAELRRAVEKLAQASAPWWAADPPPPRPPSRGDQESSNGNRK
jgi:Mrp family chromosome partitioning ATPase